MNQEKDTRITITTQTYFGTYFYNIGWCLLVAGLPMLIIKLYIGVLLIALGTILVTTVYRLEFDLDKKTIDDYLFFLGKKRNLVSKSFETLGHISVKEGRYSQQLNYKSLSTVVEGSLYSAYIWTDDTNYYLGESKREKTIVKKAKILAGKLGVTFQNETDSNK